MFVIASMLPVSSALMLSEVHLVCAYYVLFYLLNAGNMFRGVDLLIFPMVKNHGSLDHSLWLPQLFVTGSFHRVFILFIFIPTIMAKEV